MKKILTAAMLVALAAPASAATLDFVALAAGTPGDRGGVEGQTFLMGSPTDNVDVTFSSTYTGGNSAAYLDDLSGGPGGLGVCHSGLGGSGGAQCLTSSDDNVSEGETVTISFNKIVSSFTNWVFHDANHNPLTNSHSLTVAINNDSATTTSFAALISGAYVVSGNITSLTLGYVNKQFYLSSVDALGEGGGTLGGEIPLPAGLPLLIGGMAALGIAKRRQKKA